MSRPSGNHSSMTNPRPIALLRRRGAVSVDRKEVADG